MRDKNKLSRQDEYHAVFFFKRILYSYMIKHSMPWFMKWISWLFDFVLNTIKSDFVHVHATFEIFIVRIDWIKWMLSFKNAHRFKLSIFLEIDHFGQTRLFWPLTIILVRKSTVLSHTNRFWSKPPILNVTAHFDLNRSF